MQFVISVWVICLYQAHPLTRFVSLCFFSFFTRPQFSAYLHLSPEVRSTQPDLVHTDKRPLESNTASAGKEEVKMISLLFDGGVWPLWPAPVTVHFFFIFICKRLKEDLRFTRSLLNRPKVVLKYRRLVLKSLQQRVPWEEISANHSQVTAIFCSATIAAHFVLSLCSCFCFSLLISATETSQKKIIPERQRMSGRCAAHPSPTVSHSHPPPPALRIGRSTEVILRMRGSQQLACGV